MYVCICNAITDKQIRQAAESGARNLWDLQKELGVAAGCGTCKETAADILRDHRRSTSTNIEVARPQIHRSAAA